MVPWWAVAGPRIKSRKCSKGSNTHIDIQSFKVLHENQSIQLSSWFHECFFHLVPILIHFLDNYIIYSASDLTSFETL